VAPELAGALRAKAARPGEPTELLVDVAGTTAASVAASVPAELCGEDAACRAGLHAAAVSPKRLRVTLGPGASAGSAARRLAERGDVVWVAERPRVELLNYYARSTLQDNAFPAARLTFVDGLDGAGQVVAVTDTGVDFDSCFFADPTCPVPSGDAPHACTHRKIVRYMELSGTDGRGDESNGHGTHVAGSIAASYLRVNGTTGADADFNGMAPAAKLAVYDIKKATSGELFIPDDLYHGVFVDAHDVVSAALARLRARARATCDSARGLGARAQAGARVSSNSWGASGGTYDQYCYDTDAFMWDHPHFLIVYAAGNYGNSGAPPRSPCVRAADWPIRAQSQP
jgi:subtilisin family serine protease